LCYILIAHTVFRRASLADLENGLALLIAAFWPISVCADAAFTIGDTVSKFFAWMDKRGNPE